MRLLPLLLALAACAKPWTPEAAYARVLSRVQALRGLRLDPPPELKVWTRAQWIARVRAESRPAPAFEALWHALGIVAAGDDSTRAFDAVKQQFRGYYDLSEHSLYYFTDTPERYREAQLAHGLLHALQRQHGPLYALARDEETWGYLDDISWAFAAAREGEAVLIELAWPNDRLALVEGLESRLEIDGVSPYAARWAYFGYLCGARFLRARARGSLRSTCDALYLDPPLSTEQVLHPDRSDPPVCVVAPDLSAALGKGWELATRTVLGEWTLADWVAALEKRSAPIGGGLPDRFRWGGDLAQVYRQGERFLVIVWTLWDDQASAVRFDALASGSVRRGKLVVFTSAPVRLGDALDRVRTFPFRSVDQLRAALGD